MGLFDFFKKKPSPAEPPPEPKTPAPAAPQRGTIIEFDPADGLGSIRLADQTVIRFGRSACRGDFQPLAGSSVEVAAIGASPLGHWRATEVLPTAEAKAESDAARARDDRGRAALGSGRGRATRARALEGGDAVTRAFRRRDRRSRG